MDNKEILTFVELQQKILIKYLSTFFKYGYEKFCYLEDIKQHITFSKLNPEE